ncbi:TetR family transcriptional regulator [Solwaraspora sp. WMMD937]|nr:TetR family transcriptional regulator [Solwaraspora sp. WMMD937]WFE22078.1 TetR family transcriptional regulator [Solwaraspora sp. WMMD937]
MGAPGRERKKAATRAALSWAAIRLPVERGFDNVLVDDIAQAVGASARTFNNYFSSEAEAIASRHLDRSLRLADGLRARPADEVGPVRRGCPRPWGRPCCSPSGPGSCIGPTAELTGFLIHVPEPTWRRPYRGWRSRSSSLARRHPFWSRSSC